MNEMEDNGGYEDKTRLAVRRLDDVTCQRDDREMEEDWERDKSNWRSLNEIDEWLYHIAFTYGK